MHPQHEGLHRTPAAQAAGRTMNRSKVPASTPAGKFKSTIHRVHRTLSKASLSKGTLTQSYEQTSKAPEHSTPSRAPSGTTSVQPEISGQGSKKAREKYIIHTTDDHDEDDEDDPWDGRAILALDGGGVRGLASLLVLKHLMDYVSQIERDEETDSKSPAPEYRPYHYFDFIGGTSTGGLVAIMLGRLRMTVEEALAEYKKLSENFTRKKGHNWMKHPWGSSPDAAHYEDVIQRAFKQMLPDQSSVDEEDKLFRSDPMRCKTVVCSMLLNPKIASVEPVLFRSYPISSGDEMLAKNADLTGLREIWEVASATSATQAYFKPFSSGANKYTDPAPYLCNPSWEVYKECTKARNANASHIDLFLSIGSEATAHTLNPTHRGKLRLHVVNKMLKRAALIQKFADVVDDAMRKSSHSEIWYRRVNVDAETMEGGSIEESCKNFVERPEVQKELEESALILVKMRKRRETTMFWEQFAEGVRYKCPILPGEHKEYFKTRAELKDHLQASHSIRADSEHNEDMQKQLDAGRREGSVKSGNSTPERQPSN